MASVRQALAHLRKPDHWTALVGLALVLANVALGDRRISGVAALFLLAALAFDAWEAVRGDEP